MKTVERCVFFLNPGAFFLFVRSAVTPFPDRKKTRHQWQPNRKKSRGSIPTRASRSEKKVQTEISLRKALSLQRKSVTMMGITTILRP